MKSFHFLISTLLLGLMTCCNTNPQPIEYGVDGCHFCTMTIVDRLHAAELVTTKGKIYKFDASECMIHYMQDSDPSQIKHFLSNNYLKAGELIDATRATFLISDKIPSPMGASLSAFKTHEEALSVKKEKGGTLYSWSALLDHLE
jgi:copper chaperone NosL